MFYHRSSFDVHMFTFTVIYMKNHNFFSRSSKFLGFLLKWVFTRFVFMCTVSLFLFHHSFFRMFFCNQQFFSHSVLNLNHYAAGNYDNQFVYYDNQFMYQKGTDQKVTGLYQQVESNEVYSCFFMRCGNCIEIPVIYLYGFFYYF